MCIKLLLFFSKFSFNVNILLSRQMFLKKIYSNYLRLRLRLRYAEFKSLTENIFKNEI